MPNKEKRRTRKQKLAEEPPHPSTRGNRELSRIARMCSEVPHFLDEISELRYEGQWVMNKNDLEVDISLKRLQQKRNSTPFRAGEASIFSEGKVTSIEDRKKKDVENAGEVESEQDETELEGAAAAATAAASGQDKDKE